MRDNAAKRATTAQHTLPARSPDGHKGTFGTVAIIGGCAAQASRMIGAPALAGRAALRAGAGLLRLVMPEGILDTGLGLLPSATGVGLPTRGDGSLNTREAWPRIASVLDSADSVVIGPGLGGGPGAVALVERVIRLARGVVVIDADGLNALAELPEVADLIRASGREVVLTPHPGEFRRLAAGLAGEGAVSREAACAMGAMIDQDRSRAEAAGAMADLLGCVVVLKGSRTVVATGQGVATAARAGKSSGGVARTAGSLAEARAWIHHAPRPALATAGTGDVLAGLIGGLAAQYSATLTRPASAGLFDLTCAAVSAHGLAAEAWSARHHADAGLLAAELADELPGVLARMRNSPRPAKRR
jgi:NAD(P)H-hydrate epimerase